jgi:hypothetical protein
MSHIKKQVLEDIGESLRRRDAQTPQPNTHTYLNYAAQYFA